jgi:UDP-N-acetylmuramoyl-tripeptide--D-alanyl-D-alanine ligase
MQFPIKILAFLLKKEAQIIIKKYKPVIIGVTGNVGKTSTRMAIYEVLKSKKRVRTAVKNFNNELGLPATIIGELEGDYSFWYWFKTILLGLKIILINDKNYPEILVLEYGIDKPGDMDKLLSIVTPFIGVITQIGEIPVHIEFFESRLELVREKSKLIFSLPHTGFAVLNADSIDIDYFKEKTKALPVTYGMNKNADLKITGFKTDWDKKRNVYFSEFNISYNGTKINLHLENVCGEMSAYVCGAAFVVGLIFNIHPEKIKEVLSLNYKNPPGRQNILKGINDSIIIDDTYNASPESVKEALNVLSRLPAKRKIAVLGDMLELGVYTLEAHEKIGKIASKVCDILITLGEKAIFIKEGALKNGFNSKKIFSFNNINETTSFLKNLLRKGDLVLIKGSQGVRMEKITKELMLDKEDASKLLVRQSPNWLAKKGLYD